MDISMTIFISMCVLRVCPMKHGSVGMMFGQWNSGITLWIAYDAYLFCLQSEEKC